MTDNHSPLSFARQLALLRKTLVDASGKPYSIPYIAQHTDITQQALQKLLGGQSENPRLNTLFALCRFYHISLDYFGCDTESACLAYLAQHRITNAPSLVHEIAQEANTLSPKGKRNILAVLEWLRVGRAKK
jgi:transcriptional regulator with XRE-family HTH domain